MALEYHDVAAPSPGLNYDKAEFRLWLPPEARAIRALLVLVPGSNDDGRPAVTTPLWQDFATRNRIGLVGCRLTDVPHPDGYIETYADASKGSGSALIEALSSLAKASRHPEVATAPLLMWGMSAGGQFNYEFNAWCPERVAAFVVNKGGIYYTALTAAAARQVPGLLFIGGKDMGYRTDTIKGLFAVNRRAGALWALVNEPAAAHEEGQSVTMACRFYEDILTQRLPEDWPGPMNPLQATRGFIGDPATRIVVAAPLAMPCDDPTSWLPTQRCANDWQALAAGRTIAPCPPKEHP